MSKEYVMQLEATIQNLRKDNALLKDIKNEQDKVLKIIFEKKVDIALLKESENSGEYNMHFPYREIYHLTEEEFELVRRWTSFVVKDFK